MKRRRFLANCTGVVLAAATVFALPACGGTDAASDVSPAAPDAARGVDPRPASPSKPRPPSSGEASPTDAGVPAPVAVPCLPQPGGPALVHAGLNAEGFILPGGRRLTPTGINVDVGGFPIDTRVHPTLGVAYVSNTGDSKRSVQVVDLVSGSVVQEILRAGAYYGIALSPDGRRLYASGGTSGLVEVYDIVADGTLAAIAQVSVDKTPAGLALSPDGKRLWVGQFKGTGVVEVDTAKLTVSRTMFLPVGGYAVAHVPSRDELYVSAFGSDQLYVLNVSLGVVTGTIRVGGNPLGLAVSPDGGRVYATVTNGDVVVAIDTATRKIVASQAVGEASIARADGSPLPASTPSGIAIDSAHNRLFVTRAADNAVAILRASDLAPLAAIPVAWYPTSVALDADGTRIVVTNGKGVGEGPLLRWAESGPYPGGRALMSGSVSVIGLRGLDLPALTLQVEKNVRRPNEVFPFECDEKFPVPAKQGGLSPIEHIVLIVRENKTYDLLLGDIGKGESEPTFAIYGKDVTPNLHALANRFAFHDNFYADSEASTQGHLWLTSSFVNDYMERVGYLEDSPNDSALPPGRPPWVSFFAHLMRSKLDFRMYGEAVGATDIVDGSPVASHVDFTYPGTFFNIGIKDEEKARHVASDLVDAGHFPPFVYVSLPDDHNHGYSAGELTPQAMINDNDYATGLLIDRISHSKFWPTTAVFVVEDDPQDGADHIDYHRTICVVASPWARRGHVSSVHTSFPSLFRTFELIFNLPPMNRYDALATPLWDAFDRNPNLDPYTAIARTVPDATNPAHTMAARVSSQMDFRGPDRNPDLGDLLWWSAKGELRPGSRLAKVLAGELPVEEIGRGEVDEDEADERDVYDAALRRARVWLRDHPDVASDFRAEPVTSSIEAHESETGVFSRLPNGR